MLIQDLEKKALEVRINLLKLCNKEVIHIGGDLSVTDIMTVLWNKRINYNPNNPKDEKRDRFVLSKGHTSAVTSFCQASIGSFSAEDVINEYASDSGRFSMHSCALENPFVEVSTGSLGHGLPVSCGIAAALKLKNNVTSRVYTIMGDEEQSEGSIWETAINPVKYKLGNLVAIVYNNGLEGDGELEEITGLGDLSKKYKAFGWNVMEIDVNDVTQIVSAFDNLSVSTSSVPTCIVAHTVKGKVVDFMEDQVRWHTGKISDEQLDYSVKQLKADYCQKWMIDCENV